MENAEREHQRHLNKGEVSTEIRKVWSRPIVIYQLRYGKYGYVIKQTEKKEREK